MANEFYIDYNENPRKVYINEFKTTIPNNEFHATKLRLINNAKMQEKIQSINNNVDDIINPELNNSKYYEEVRNALKEDILNRIVGMRFYVDDAVTQQINDMLDKTMVTIKNMISTDVQYNAVIMALFDNQIVNRISRDLTVKVKEEIVEETDEVTFNVAQVINESLNVLSDSANNIPSAISSFISKVINNCGNTSKEVINQYIENEILNVDVGSLINSTMFETLNLQGPTAIMQIQDMIMNSTKNLIRDINGNISDVFCSPRALEARFKSMQNTANRIMQEQSTINAVSKLKDDIQKKMIENRYNLNKLDDPGSSNYTFAGGTEKGGGNKNNVKNRNGNPGGGGNSGGGGGGGGGDGGGGGGDKGSKEDSAMKHVKGTGEKPKKGDKPDKDEPEKEDYKDDPPPRAEGSELRKDKVQELMFWETKDEQYVLLRDGIGNYLLFDEKKKCIRLQHECGSYIQLNSAGDIEIEAKRNVLINCKGPEYKPQT